LNVDGIFRGITDQAVPGSAGVGKATNKISRAFKLVEVGFVLLIIDINEFTEQLIIEQYIYVAAEGSRIERDKNIGRNAAAAIYDSAAFCFKSGPGMFGNGIAVYQFSILKSFG
jgi:hypothetical protein